MCLRKILLGIVLCFMSMTSFGQKSKLYNGGKSMYTRERHNYSATQVRGAKAKTICPIFETSKYPYHGLGIKLGDPFAITYKFYASKNFSIAADFGKAASGLYNQYFREKFDGYIPTDTFSMDNASISYLTHKVKSDFVGEIKFLYHLDASKISPGLQAYIGAGWEFKNTRLEYDYLYNAGITGTPDRFGRFDRLRSTMGPQVVLGIEYAYFSIPLSAFMELEYFTDIQADPGWTRVQGGVGLRYIF